MTPRCLLLAGAFLVLTAAVRAESPATNTPPGPMQIADSTNAEPETPAPPQARTKSAHGANSPNGANGTTISGKPITKAPNTPAKKKPISPEAAPPPADGPAPQEKNPPTPPADQKTETVLDHYLQDLNAALKLSAEEKTDIRSYYLQDGPAVQSILNNGDVSPLEQATQVADLRDKRNDKIQELLANADRQQDFLRVESIYRVALTEAAGDGKLTPAQPGAPAPVVPSTDPAAATPIPTKNGPNEASQ